jgi:hypothetical protein
MASSGKKKTTMAKLARESRLRERRLDKQARKDARRRGATAPADEGADIATGSAHPLDVDVQRDVDDRVSVDD